MRERCDKPPAETGRPDLPFTQAHTTEEPRTLPHAPLFHKEALRGGSLASDPLSSRADPGRLLDLLKRRFLNYKMGLKMPDKPALGMP